MPSNHLILCCSLLLLPSVVPSIRILSNESVLPIRWTKYWSFSFSTSPFNGHPGLTYFRMDWLDLLAVQGTLKSFLQYYSSEILILQHSAFIIIQFSHPNMTTGKAIYLTRRTFVGKVTSLLFNRLSRFVIAFLPRSKHLLTHGCSHHLQWFRSLAFSLSSFIFIKRLFRSSLLFAIRVVSSVYLRLLIFFPAIFIITTRIL